MPTTDHTATTGPRHVFLAGARQSDRLAALAGLDLPESLLPPVSAHRRLRGPYTGAGTLLRAIVPAALRERPELVAAHEVEILTAAPELREQVPATMETLTSLAAPEERTRYYSRLRTLRIAHGLAEFLRDLLAGSPPRSVVFDDLDQADPTDQEFLAVLLRRVDPGRLTVVVGGTAALPDQPPTVAPRPDNPVTEELPGALARFCRRVDAPTVNSQDPVQDAPAELAARYVDGDGTSDDPALLAAYRELPVEARQRLHERRAKELAGRGERSLSFGAIPYHLEHGIDRIGRGGDALAEGMDACMLHGFYHATIDFCERGRAVAGWAEQPALRWKFTSKLPTSLAAMGRTADAEVICDEARANSVDPAVHMLLAYTTSMLYTRHHSERDHQKALIWINEAVVIASLLPNVKQRAFHTVFNNNGLALIEAHRGRPEQALALVSNGLSELDRDLGPGEQQLHRSVLRHNRAQVLAGLGRPAEALDDYRAVIDADPYYPEYHFELANLLGKLGRADEALAEYDTAMRLGPPFPEVYYNRGDLRLTLDDVEGALADFDYVLELDPEFVDAYVNRAGILLDEGELDAAERDVLAGLARQPGNALLLAALGRVHAEREQPAAARTAFDRALAVDGDLVAALSGRATIAYLTNDLDTAIADLARAVELVPDDPALRYNRALVLQDAGRWADALTDLAAAAELAPDDEDIRQAQRECRARTAV